MLPASPNPSFDGKAKGSSRPLSKLNVSLDGGGKWKGAAEGEEVRLAEWEIAGEETVEDGRDRESAWEAWWWRGFPNAADMDEVRCTGGWSAGREGVMTGCDPPMGEADRVVSGGEAVSLYNSALARKRGRKGRCKRRKSIVKTSDAVAGNEPSILLILLLVY